MCFSAEADEFWNFVGKKSSQRRTWHVMERRSGIVLAWHSGKGQERDCELLNPCSIQKYRAEYFPPRQRQTGKDGTWKIERKNFNFIPFSPEAVEQKDSPFFKQRTDTR
ncbi:MAG: hypothetical protein LBD80_07900 [Tannerella sp.]|jgi:IS1 family transposase|nr:hypothetical protein [Tannerella sp.]